MLATLLKPMAFLVAYMVSIFTLWLGLNFDWHELQVLFRRKLVWRALLLALIIVPIIAITVVKILPLSPLVSAMLVIFAICLGVPLMVIGPQKAVVSKSTSIGLSLILTASVIIALPVWYAIAQGFFPGTFVVPFRNIVESQVLKIFLPFVIGWNLKVWAPSFARKLSPWTDKAFKIVLVMAAVLLIVVSLPAWTNLTVWIFAAMFIVIGLSTLIGDFLGRPQIEDRTLLAACAIYGNPAIALAIIHASFPDLKVAPALAVYLLLRIAASQPYSLWVKHSKEARLETPAHG